MAGSGKIYFPKAQKKLKPLFICIQYMWPNGCDYLLNARKIGEVMTYRGRGCGYQVKCSLEDSCQNPS